MNRVNLEMEQEVVERMERLANEAEEISNEIVDRIPARFDRHTAYELYVIRDAQKEHGEGLRIILKMREHDEGIEMWSEVLHVTEPISNWDDVLDKVASKLQGPPRFRKVDSFERTTLDREGTVLYEYGIVMS